MGSSTLVRSRSDPNPGRDRTPPSPGRRIADALDLVSAVARSITWAPIVMGAFASTALVALRHGHVADSPLFFVVVLLSSPIGFALDDPAAETLAASPTSLLRRRLLRLALVVPAVGTIWVLLLTWTFTQGPEETWGLTVIFTGLVGLTLGASGVAGRLSGGRAGGIFASVTVLVLLFLSPVLSPRWRPLPMGDIPGGWTQVSIRWAAAAIVGTIVFLASSSDPAARVRRRGCSSTG